MFLEWRLCVMIPIHPPFLFSPSHSPYFLPSLYSSWDPEHSCADEQERRFDSDFILFKWNEVPLACLCLLLYSSVSSWWMQASCCLHPLWLVSHRFFNLSARPSSFPSIRFSFSFLSVLSRLNIFFFPMMSVLTYSSTLYFQFPLWFGVVCLYGAQ